MKNYVDLEEETWKLYQEARVSLQDKFCKLDRICEENTAKVLAAFWANHVSESHFGSTTGYGYDDAGRDVIEQIYAQIFGAEDALVRTQFISGSHALSKTLFGILRPGDLLLSISGTPYDTLHEVIGIIDNPSSLKSFGVLYDEISLVNDDFDEEKIVDYLKSHFVKVVEIQRSKGYSSRKSISIDKCQKIIAKIKEVSPKTFVMVDNCYCEFVGVLEPTEVGADVVVGSLIKNLGGSIASNGAYICGDKKLIELCAERLNLPGEGIDVGPSLGANKSILQGLYFAPSVVASSLKTAVLTSYLLEKLGYEVSPRYNEARADIVEAITFKDKNLLIKYVQNIQASSPIDSSTLPIPAPMPGYDDEIIMASGSFTQGSSIELSCDGPLREPFIAYQQGGVTYNYGKIAVINAIKSIFKS